LRHDVACATLDHIIREDDPRHCDELDRILAVALMSESVRQLRQHQLLIMQFCECLALGDFAQLPLRD
jgi:hypothetical protein